MSPIIKWLEKWDSRNSQQGSIFLEVERKDILL